MNLKLIQVTVLCAIVDLTVCADMIIQSGFVGRNHYMNTVDNLGHAIMLYRVGAFDIVGTRVVLYAYWARRTTSATRPTAGWCRSASSTTSTTRRAG